MADGKQQPVENPNGSEERRHFILDEQTAATDIEREEEATKKYFDAITAAVNSMREKHGGDYSAHIADLLIKIREKPSEKTREEWKRRRNEMLEQNEKIRRGEMPGVSLYTTADLERETTPLAVELLQLEELIISGYLRTMTQTSDGKDITPKALEEMLESINASVNKMMEIYYINKEHPEMLIALKWSLGLGDKDRALSQSKDYVFKTLSEHLMKNTRYVAPLCWTIINYMGEHMGPEGSYRTEFAKYFIETNKLTPEKTYEFLHVGLNMGAFSPLEMKEMIEKTIPEDRKNEMMDKYLGSEKQYKVIYQAQNDFHKGAKNMVHESYQGKVGTNMITGKNIILCILQAAAVTTMVGNTAVALFKDRGTSWVNIGNLKSLITNKYFVGAGLGLGAISLLRKPKQAGRFFREKGSIEAERAAFYKKEFKEQIEGTPAWDGFFMENEYEGLQALWSYLKEIEHKNNPDKMLNVTKFKEWLVANNGKGSKSKNYGELSTRLSKIDTNDEEFKIICKAIIELEMGNTNAKAAYMEAMGRKQKVEIPDNIT